MLVKIFITSSLFAVSFAWLAPERCKQSDKLEVTVTPVVNTTYAGIVPSIEEIAAKQNELLKKTYENHQFLGVPIRASCYPFEEPVYIYAAYNCTFLTYAPRILSSVACTDVACKLTHTVSTVDTYSATEGYNWGVKVTAKASFFEKIFEVGGEVSSGGTYTCTYTKGRTTTDTVECSVSTGKNGYLQLYNVRSDMECDIGKITLTEDLRDNRPKAIVIDYFTKGELEEIEASAAANFDPCPEIIIDPNKISDSLFRKILKEIPHYNIFTDMVSINPNGIAVYYFKKTKYDKEYRTIIPFTREDGDSVFQYACMLTPF